MAMLKLFILLSLLVGLGYPIAVTGLAQSLFPEKSQGSVVRVSGKVVGSRLLAQKFTGDQFFHPRPSAGDYATVASGASQFSPTSAKGNAALAERRRQIPAGGVDLWTTSGSGLDPDLSPESALAQVPRVAQARGIEARSLTELIHTHTQGPTLGIWGRPRVNVLELNLALLNQGHHGHSGSASHRP